MLDSYNATILELQDEMNFYMEITIITPASVGHLDRGLGGNLQFISEVALVIQEVKGKYFG